MTGILSALLREKSLNSNKSEEKSLNENSTQRSNSTLLSRLTSSAVAMQPKKRRKRSRVFNRYFLPNNRGLAFAKRKITWRLVRKMEHV